ncbi:hypothetical protein [Corynebacterium sp. TAE3-ERU16]|uniref:hypothetical protein n=1 Tax=Corynebacterium sp. TAE3-ERU16 TaxID=2849493 RepID=UPI001C43A258|nr:hypothetical protein [Corynebacterium sp. TAE3-ERU16]MBV7292864.1 hypothetical protein [Corynebacterium sp. TAE3-ERU16]
MSSSGGEILWSVGTAQPAPAVPMSRPVIRENRRPLDTTSRPRGSAKAAAPRVVQVAAMPSHAVPAMPAASRPPIE